MQEISVIDKYGSKRKCIMTLCECCNKEFLVRKDFLKKGRGKYCSKECVKKSKIKKYATIICAACGKEKQVPERVAKKITKYGYKFCSLECKNKSQCIGGLIEPEHYKNISPKKPPRSIDHKCLFCKKELDKHQRQFCSKGCRSDYRYDQYIKEWKTNGVSGNYAGEEYLHALIRRYMLEKNGYKCSKCGWDKINPATGKSPLNINHIDGCSFNSIESNLEVICPNCHSLTPNYGSLNKGKGRKKRLQKIHQKSGSGTA